MRNDISEIINRITEKDMELAKLFEYFAKEFLEMEELTENFSKRFSKKDTYSSKGNILNHELLKSQLKYLPEVATAINPKNIIPIHTFSKSQYQTIFKQKVLLLDNNQNIQL